MLENATNIKSAFINPLTSARKLIECIRVDGAADEGPSHEEVQFMWTARHLSKPTLATLVTARNSGSSYLNRAIGGSCMDSTQIHKERYENNMTLATDVYMNRVNGCPCGETVSLVQRCRFV